MLKLTQHRLSTMLKLSKPIAETLSEAGFEFSTVIQIPIISFYCSPTYENRDMAVNSPHGSGKTLAFVIVVVELFHRACVRPNPYQVMGMIISLTREISSHTHTLAQPLISSLPGFGSVLLGGDTDAKTIQEQGANLLIGTPETLLDIMDQIEIFDFSIFQVLIIDQADRLLDMGFQEHLNSIISRLPKERRTGLSTATVTEAVDVLVETGLSNRLKMNFLRVETPSYRSSRVITDENRARFPNLRL